MIVRDEKHREILRTNDNGDIVVAHFVDMSEDTKNYIIECYKELTNEDPNKIRNFLDFKITEVNKIEFCS